MKKDLIEVKTRLIELGYLDNEWLDKYLEVIEANLETKKSKKSTQAHHAIPVNSYWNSINSYNRKEALKAAKADTVNFEVNLLYKDHLLIHSYLTLCTELNSVQAKYEAQAELRRSKSFTGKHFMNKDGIVILVDSDDILTKLEAGWLPGKKPGAYQCYVHKGTSNKRVSFSKLSTYLSNGWIFGVNKNTNKN